MRIAFFPGKFQPVHLGHIITLMKLYNKFDRIIIGITEDKPEVLTQEERKKLFNSVLKHLSKFEIVLIKGTIAGSKSADNLPDFDICLTGNQKVIDTLNKLGLKSKFIKRSRGIGHSGTDLRGLTKENNKLEL